MKDFFSKNDRDANKVIKKTNQRYINCDCREHLHKSEDTCLFICCCSALDIHATPALCCAIANFTTTTILPIKRV